MTSRPTRRGLAVGAAALPAAFFIGAAHAQSAPESTLDRVTRTKQPKVNAALGKSALEVAIAITEQIRAAPRA